MSLSYSRGALLRRPQLLRQHFSAQTRRQASTAEVAKEKAAEATSKASEGLSKVSSSANAVASKATGSVGGRIGSLVGTIQSLVPHTIYYSKVGLELAKMVFETRKMALPSGAQFQSYYNCALQLLRNPSQAMSQIQSTASSLQQSNILSRVRNMSRDEMISSGVVAAEVLGFFTVGEMVGRMKVVGYRSNAPREEH